MILKEKSVSTLSHFLSDAKFSTVEMQALYASRALFRYKINKRKGYFIIDDTMTHHSKFCKWLHGVFVLFDHAIGTNLKARCIVVLYYSDGGSAKFPLTFRIYYQESSKMPWARKKKSSIKRKMSWQLKCWNGHWQRVIRLVQFLLIHGLELILSLRGLNA